MDDRTKKWLFWTLLLAVGAAVLAGAKCSGDDTLVSRCRNCGGA